MSEKVKMRSSNLELLRIFAMMGVVILHYNNEYMGGGFAYVAKGSLNYWLLYVLEAFAISAVNLFILISGYFMCTSDKRPVIKPLKLIVQVIVFKEAIYIFSYIMSATSSGAGVNAEALGSGILDNLVPNNYFVILYMVLYFISVYINIVFDALDEVKTRRMMITLLILFSLWPTLADIFNYVTGISWNGLSTIGLYGSQNGYTIVNFALMYMIGAYLRKYSHKTYKEGKLIVAYICIIAVISVWFVAGDLFGAKSSNVAYEYCNPLVILSAVLIFLIFKQLKMPSSKIINGLAKGSFTVFLAHTVFIPYLKIPSYCSRNVMVQMIHILVSCVVIYMLSWIMYFVYEKLTNPIFGLIEKKLQKNHR